MVGGALGGLQDAPQAIGVGGLELLAPWLGGSTAWATLRATRPHLTAWDRAYESTLWAWWTVLADRGSPARLPRRPRSSMLR